MDSVSEWLAQLGLPHYAQAFAENDIDMTVIPHLSESDLRELGVVSLGHRRKLLAAIAALARPGAVLDVPTGEPAALGSAAAAERRQITVLFCDLVGSTAMSAKLDPEDVREVIGAYQGACAREITKYEGFVAKYLGDGVIAYFGFPRAHEDDAERAVRAGLDIARAIGGLTSRTDTKLSVRIGIATGLVVVGDLMGQGSAQRQAVGGTPNLAARLQALAEPGCVVVSDSTRRLLGHRFKLRRIEPEEADGLEAFAVDGPTPIESRFEAAHAERLSGFIGRQKEIALLRDRTARAWAGEGQIVLISGEPGIGKSRFVARVEEELRGEPHTRLRYQCSPYHRNSALHPFVAQLERAAAIAADDPPERKLAKLEATLDLAPSEVQERAPLFASLLSIPHGQRYAPRNLSPAQQRRLTFAALLDRVESLARQQPVLIIFEDAQWADATSLEVLDLAVERIRTLRVLLLVTFRTDYEPPWTGMPHVVHLALTRLDRGEVELLVERMAGGRKLPAEVMAQIVARTDGVPLFVEELTKTVRESGLLREEDDRYRLDRPLPPLAIPSTLQDSLMARLDRLSPVKEIAQIGAAIGREFSYVLLSAVAGRDETELQAALAQLEQAELVFRAGAPPEARYIFKHALVRDTAYESLLKSRRQTLHKRIAEALCDRFPTVAAAEPEVIATHFAQAGLDEAAIEWWRKAAELALRRFALKEAITHLRAAIDLADRAAVAPRPEARLQLQIGLGNALLASRGFAAAEAVAAFDRARQFAAEIQDPAERVHVYRGLWNTSYIRGELAAMREVSQAMLREAEARPGTPEHSVALRFCGLTAWYQGDFLAARRQIEAALAIDYDPEADRSRAFRFVHDQAAIGGGQLAIVLWVLGEIERARRLMAEVIGRAEASGHAFTIVQTHMLRVHLAMLRRDAGQARASARIVAELAQQHEIPMFQTLARTHAAWSEFDLGEDAAGLDRANACVGILRDQGFQFSLPGLNVLLAEAQASAGRLDAALAAVTEALAHAEHTGEHWTDADAHRVRGRILSLRDAANPAPAEAAFRTAIAIARQQQARSFELRAAFGLAELYSATHRRAEARAVLAPLLAEYSSSSEYPEIATARRLLAELAMGTDGNVPKA